MRGLAALVLLALVGCELAERQCAVAQVCAEAAERLGVGSEPEQIALRDLDGDGRLDLVAISPKLGTLAVTWGFGLVNPATDTWPIGQEPGDLAFGDVDGDGREDVVVPLRSDGSLALLRGAGPRRLGGLERLAVGRRPVAATTADLDGDGRAEIVVVDGLDDDLRVLAYEATGLVARPPVAVGAGPAGVVAGDFSGDGLADVVVTLELEGVARLFFGSGDASLRAGPELYVGAGPTRLLAADLDDDGLLDLALIDALVDEAAVVFGDGAGQARETLRVAVPAGPVHLALGTGSKGRELLVLSGARGAVTQIPVAAPEQQLTTPGWQWEGLAVGDVDGDGAAEVVISGDGGEVLRRGPGFGFVPWYEHAELGLRGPLAAHDVDRDGWLDLVVHDAGQREIVILRGEEGGFAAPLRSPGPERAAGLVMADVDGDGAVDVVTWQPAAITPTGEQVPGAVWTARGTTNGFAAPIEFALPGDPLQVFALDEDGDGRSELLTMQGRYRALIGEEPVDSGPGLLTLQLVDDRLSLVRKSMSQQFAFGGALAMGDFSAEFAGDEQIGLAPTPEGWEVVVESHSAGLEWRSGSLLPLSRPQGMTRGDVTGDGVADLVLCSQEGLTVVPGLAWNMFGPGQALGGGSCSSAALAELDGDGRIDLITVQGREVAVRLAHALPWLPSFTSGGTTTTSNGPLALVVADFDRDGLPDLAASGLDGLQVRRGAPQEVLLRKTRSADTRLWAGRPGGLELGDVDGDGTDEVIALGGEGDVGVGFFAPSTGTLGPVRYHMSERALAVRSAHVSQHKLVLDLDGDGADELLWAFEWPDPGVYFTEVQRWNGTELAPATTLPIVISTYGSVVAGDVDGDGADDLVYVSPDGTLTSHLGGPEGLSPARAGPRLETSTINLRLADVDRDGQLDAIVSLWIEGAVQVYRGDGLGSFVAAPQQWPINGRANVIVAGDVDGDGFGDLIASGHEDWTGNIRVCHGGEHGPRGDCHSAYVGPDLAGVIALAVEDVDGDGVTDLLAIVTDDDSRWLVFGRGGSGQWAISEKPLPVGPLRSNMPFARGALRKARLDAEGPEWVYVDAYELTRLGLRVP